ncbi:MAG: M3 family metallopeptidase [Gemmatimonadota bacterium]
MMAHSKQNPLLAEWPGPHGGLPPFDAIEIHHFKPALYKGMREMITEIVEIVEDPEPPTFRNTIEALERSGRLVDRVGAVYRVWGSNLTGPAFQALEREMNPKLTAHWDRVRQDEGLFRRIEAVHETAEKEGLTPEQQRLTWLYYTNHVRAGAKLEGGAKARVAEMNERLSTLFTRFSANLLADEAEYALVLESEADLDGLPGSAREAAAAAAETRGAQGRWAIANTRSSVVPFLTYATRRDLRERAWRMFTGRGDMGGDHDNKAIISEVLALRAERARLLGYPTHAHLRLENQMAKTPEAAMQLLEAVWTPAVARVGEEVAAMQEIVDAEGHDFRVEPWDYRYYAEKVRRDRYDLDHDALASYLQLDRLRDGMFWVAGELFGYRFERVADVPVFHPDVEVWAVSDESGRHLGLFYFDPFARKGKRSGAWMTSYRNQERFAGEVTTLVSNNSNFVRSRPGDPVLISWTDAVTLFHEFGHALNGLASNVTYPSLAGTPGERDYVEFPSQLLEHWLTDARMLRRFARHAQTGEPLPDEVVDRIENAARFNQGFATVEYLVNAIVDMELHLAGDRAIDPAAYEEEAIERLGVPREIAMRHRLPQFAHAFASDGYSAGYYGYLWSDVLTADAYEAFLEASGPYDREIAERFRECVLSRGSSLDPAEGYRLFRGRDPEIGGLMRKRGFEAAAV